jgi:hypothetical protein
LQALIIAVSAIEICTMVALLVHEVLHHKLFDKVAGTLTEVSAVPVQMWRGEPSPGADVAGRAQSRRRCGRGWHAGHRLGRRRPPLTAPRRPARRSVRCARR